MKWKVQGQIWRALRDSKNIQPKLYDQDIVFKLSKSLNIPDAAAVVQGHADFAQAIDDHHVSREELIYALCSVAQPFAEMMAQLCGFFERHAVHGTDRALRMEFDFGDPGRELAFDLKQFREWLSQWEKVESIVETDCWDISLLWKLVHAISPEISREADVRGKRAREWIAASAYPGGDTTPDHWAAPPKPPLTGIIEIDRAVNRIFSAVSSVARACSPWGNYARLNVEGSTQRPAGTRSVLGESGNAAPIMEWPVWSLYLLEDNFFFAALMRVLWHWVEQLHAVPAGSRLSAAQPAFPRVEAMFSSIHTRPARGGVDLERLLSFLRMPVWKERPALYAAWMLPVIEQALVEYPAQIHHENGTLRFSFKATAMASFKSSQGEITLVAEHCAPLENPVGESRKDNAQPDYVLLLGSTEDPENARVVLELKQYLRPSVKKFSAALIDYTRAFKDADVWLSDYGPLTPAAVMNPVSAELATRAAAFGNVRPGNTSQIADLQQRIRGAPPAPPPASPGQQPVAAKTILVDVSGSMREVLSWQSVRRQLHDLASANPAATWVAADTRVRATLKGADAVDQLLSLDMSDSTELAQIVAGYQGSDTLVITDEDGETQLRGQQFKIKRIGLAKAKGIEGMGSSD